MLKIGEDLNWGEDMRERAEGRELVKKWDTKMSSKYWPGEERTIVPFSDAIAVGRRAVSLHFERGLGMQEIKKANS